MGIELTFEITFRSNYHVGAGYGKGFNVDSAILREANGVPVIRGSALAGLLRDGAYRLLQLPPLIKHDTDKMLKRLFGSPERPKRWHISSARPKQIVPRDRDSQSVQRVRIDPRTRRAEPRKLFSQEEGIAGHVFRFTVSCADSDEAALDEAAFLVAAARNVRQLGRSRRRGLGECSIRLTDVRGVPTEGISDWQDWFLERFGEKWMKGEPTQAPKPPERTNFSLGNEPIPRYDGEPVRLRLILHLDEPLLIARRAPAGNHFEAREVIPGSVILGALASIVASHNDLMRDDVYRDFVSLFLRGGVTFPTLYPALFSNNYLYPTIPAPLGLLTCSIVPFSEQGDGHGTYLASKYDKCPKCESRLEPIAGFVVLRRKGTHVFTPNYSSELHIQINEATGRVTKGQLYGYTVLNAGQYFVGELRCASEEAWQRLKVMTGIEEKQPLTWRLGKARSRGYGKVTAWLERLADPKRDWGQLPLSERVKDPSQPISLTLLTDAIIQNRWGQQAVSFHEEWLEEVLGLSKVKIEDVYARSRVVDGFNTHLGLPRWRDTALSAGSVVWFTLEAPPDDWQERMAQLERDGIGFRRNEGFGHIAFNHPVYDQRDALTRSGIRLEEPMRLGDMSVKDNLIARWEKKLAGALPPQLDAPFVVLAQWLYTYADTSPSELKAQLTSLGELPDEAIELLGGEQEYGKRHTLKPEADKLANHPGVKLVEQLLTELETFFDEPFWPLGIQMLADRVAAAAGKEETK